VGFGVGCGFWLDDSKSVVERAAVAVSAVDDTAVRARSSSTVSPVSPQVVAVQAEDLGLLVSWNPDPGSEGVTMYGFDFCLVLSLLAAVRNLSSPSSR
jgi:hypothetical protein